LNIFKYCDKLQNSESPHLAGTRRNVISQTLSLLLIEDSESDAELIIRQFQKVGYRVSHERVETAEEMREALKRKTWDAIIADYTLPEFNAPSALALLQESGQDMPFIVFSGTIGEDRAVALIKEGAHDYVSKESAERLVLCVKRSVEAAAERRARQEAEQAVHESEKCFRSLFENSLDGMMVTVLDGTILAANARMCEMLGMSEEEVLKGGRSKVIVKDERLANALEERARTGKFMGELSFRCKDGSILPVELSACVFTDFDGILKSCLVVRDIADRKQAEEALKQAHDELEQRVELRTAEVRKQAEALGELNTALKVLVEHYKGDQREQEEKVVSNIRVRIIPHLEKLKQTRIDEGQSALVEIIERGIRDILSPFSRSVSSEHFRFAPKEAEVASLVREGKTTKEIARILGVGKRTVDSYRDNIRGKLGLSNKKVNLRTYLLSIDNT
jgi:PAS domain S-box-containing protein